jgi:ATP-dependent Clp protease ATP-binding subunit ClpA
MFERYTEKARRVIFFARYEASQFGSPYIETEHLLLAVLREDGALVNRLVRSGATVGTIRTQIESQTQAREKVSTSVDLPLSIESRHVLAYAAEESERRSQSHIGTGDLLLGLLRDEKCLAARILQQQGLRLETVREEITRMRESHLREQAVTVLITSTPTAAEIEVDGTFLGTTPAELPLPVGEHVVKLSKKDYQMWERKLTVLSGGRQTLTVDLEQSSQ